MFWDFKYKSGRCFNLGATIERALATEDEMEILLGARNTDIAKASFFLKFIKLVFLIFQIFF